VGTLKVTSSCPSLSVQASLHLPLLARVRATFTGTGSTPWTCSVDESGLIPASDPNADWWVFCGTIVPS
jgi:hypothetical protein